MVLTSSKLLMCSLNLHGKGLYFCNIFAFEKYSVPKNIIVNILKAFFNFTVLSSWMNCFVNR